MSWAIWITGRPGSGKSTIARHVATALDRRGNRVVVLEASAFSADVMSGRAPSAPELDIVYRALVQAAAQLTRAGVPVIIDATAHRRAWRDLARSSIEHFGEVQLVCPDTLCAAREQLARWTRIVDITSGPAASSEPDIVPDYEYSLQAELTINTDVQHPWTAAQDVLFLVERLQRTAPPAARVDKHAADSSGSPLD